MKRTAIRKTMKEPKHQSRTFRINYKYDNPEDEWVKHLSFRPSAAPKDDMRWRLPNELNHIFTNPRIDKTPLVITNDKVNHDFFHEHIHEGRVLCLLVKCRKREDDLDLWDRCFGSFSKPKSVLGWLECLEVSAPIKPYLDELVSYLREVKNRQIGVEK